MNNPTSPPARLIEQLFPGLGIGLLVGLLTGLSVSPVVSGLLTALGGLLAAMLGIQSDGGEGASRIRVNGARIGAFGFACVLGVLAGITIRVKDVLGIPIQKQVATWVDAGFEEKDARQYVAFQKTGLWSVDKGSGKMELASGELQKSRMGVLFNALGEADLCETVKLDQYGSDPEKSTTQMLGVYHSQILGKAADKRAPLYKHLDRLAGRLEKLPVATRNEVMKGLEETVCAIQEIN